MTSQISANMFPVTPEIDNTLAQAAEEAATKSFASIMNVQAKPSDDATFDKTPVKTVSNNDDKSKGFSEKDHAELKNTKVKEKVSTAKTPADDKADLKETVKSVSNEVAEVIKEEYNLTDEQLEEVLANLGLTVLDLVIPNNITEVVKSLTNTEDTITLLLDDTFKNLLETVNDIVRNFEEDVPVIENIVAQLKDENNIKVEEILTNAFAKKLDDALGFLKAGEEFIQDLENTIIEDPFELIEQYGTKPVEVKADNAEVTPTEELNPEEVIATAKVPESASKNVETKVTDENVKAEPETKEHLTVKDIFAEKAPTQDSKNDSFGAQTRNDNNNFFNAFNAHNDAPVSAEPEVQTPVFNQTFTNMEDITNLMDQVNALARLYTADDSTTIRMNLNPENLGRMLMTVTEHEGNVTAKITVTNQDVKEILNNEIIALKANLESAGVRVQEVEVTVAAHEFEENLDNFNRPMQDGSGNENNGNGQNGEAEAQGTGTGRRNINLNDLSSLEGTLTEEEQLVAEMMNISGNSVDFTA